MELKRKFSKTKSDKDVYGIAGTYRKRTTSVDMQNHKSPRVDRHGFLVSHRMHPEVSSDITLTLPGDVSMRREFKWLEMIDNWEDIVGKRGNKIKERCKKGIPQSVRSLAWQRLTGAKVLQEVHPNLYEELLAEMEYSDWGHVIRKDIPRTFRHHCMFYENNSRGQEDLYNVLIAYSCYDKETGYNQALAPVAAVLLMHMPPDETFWVLVCICKKYLPGYYGAQMEAMRLDSLIFTNILESEIPDIAKHLENNGVEPNLYLVEWMVCIFARSLPFDTVLRIWDMFFCEGVKVLFKIALAIIKLVFPNTKELEEMDDYQTAQALKKLPREGMVETVLIPEAINIELRNEDIRRIHKKILHEYPELTVNRYSGGLHQL